MEDKGTGLTWLVNIGNEDPSRIRRKDMAATADEAWEP